MSKIFHSGEETIQALLGVSGEARQLEGMVRNGLAPAAIRFLPTFRFVMATSVDAAGKVWTSFLTGPQGFISVVSDQTISLSSISEEVFSDNIKGNEEVGLLFINFEARLRLRVNGTVAIENDRVLLTIKQAYFNCPKYIQSRKTEWVGWKKNSRQSYAESLSDSQIEIIQKADTFFISTYAAGHGADCSHRGGNPGFAEVLNHNTIRWLDYPGNNLFNTIGNLQVNPNCGLLFIDFVTNRILQMIGAAQFVTRGQDRGSVIFTLESIKDISGATPFEWVFLEYSPYNVNV